MTDAEYRAQRKRLKALHDKWSTPLGLRWWRVNYEYNRDSPESRDDGRTCVAQAMVDWEYLNATITFDMQAVANETDDDDLEYYFVHECCHILVNEMRMWGNADMPEGKHDEAMHHEERVVTQMAHAFIWTYRAGRDAGKKAIPIRPKRKS